MEKKLKKIYSQAQSDVGKEWYNYMESIKPEGDRLLKAYEDAKKTDDKDLIKKTGKEYGRFLNEKTNMNKYYRQMIDSTTDKLAKVNETALQYLNGKMPKIYVENFNQLAKDYTDFRFDLVNEQTVKNLIADDPQLLPTKTLNIPKDKLWNKKSINAQVLQSIVSGESISKIAKRLTPIMDRNEASAIRNARTMTTGAQNKGRLDSYKSAQDKGVVLKKEWLATNSERTRAWHADLSGVQVDIDEPFENDYGKIMYPGDPEADPGNVYNCRCTLVTHIVGFKKADGSTRYIAGEGPNDVTTKKPTAVFHGGPEFTKFKSDRAFFTTTSKQAANEYSNKGVLQEFELKPDTRLLSVDMDGENWSKGLKILDELKLGARNDEEKSIIDKFKNDPLRAIAEVARSRNYDGALIKNVNDPKGVFSKGKDHLPLTATIDEYIITNTKRLKKRRKK